MPSSPYNELSTLLTKYVEVEACKLSIDRLKGCLQSVSSEEVFQLLDTVRDKQECTAIHKTTVRGHPEILTCFFNAVPPEQRFKLVEMRNVNRWTVLHATAFMGAIKPFESICNFVTAEQIYQLLTLKDLPGSTALHYAVSKGHRELAARMLDSVEPARRLQLLEITDRCGKTTLDLALQIGDQSTADLIRCYRQQTSNQKDATQDDGKSSCFI